MLTHIVLPFTAGLKIHNLRLVEHDLPKNQCIIIRGIRTYIRGIYNDAGEFGVPLFPMQNQVELISHAHELAFIQSLRGEWGWSDLNNSEHIVSIHPEIRAYTFQSVDTPGISVLATIDYLLSDLNDAQWILLSRRRGIDWFNKVFGDVPFD